MKAKPFKYLPTDGPQRRSVPCEAHEAHYVELNLEGCHPCRFIPVRRVEGARSPLWSWNGDTERPTLAPSIRTGNAEIGLCHSFVRDGQVQYLGDCTHEFAGQTRPLLEVED